MVWKLFFVPQFKEKTESSMEVDTVIIAIGQEADFVGFEEVKITPYKTIDADKISLATSIPLTVDDEDNVYVVDRYNHNIQKFDSEGNLLTLVRC